ncbi:MAG TPA: asparagine synthase (glutamine-hydrolyzing) [Xanthobacteraceae bacterium]|nr:asparagine synthase (glutamine-hydrolyzing) [Xanthobacteraceae bacterium]
MCGIAGFLDAGRSATADEAAAWARDMADAVKHRGPDDSDIWIDPAAGIGLGHRRLSIIDLSPLGRQPMHSADGRYVISYNGEVYNFTELRAELAGLGHSFRGGSDTEVMLAACREWGPEQAVTRFVGMFAIALWDRETATLHLIRDRMGVKPLYWCRRDGVFLFGSELKALMAHPVWRGEIDIEAAAAFVRYSYVPGTATIFRHVHKLAPGAILTMQAGAEPQITFYWRLRDVVAAPPIEDEREAVAELETILRDSIRGRMIADVPLGAFLSGGIDSSTVVALMQAQSTRKVRTFSIGFQEPGYDEANHAKEVAVHLGTDHTELYVTPRQTIDAVPSLPKWFDEPFGDSSQIPTYLVSAMTRQHVTVALSGDGGDELFAGYLRYRIVDQVWRRLGWVPQGVRRMAGAGLGALSEPLLDRAARLLPKRMRPLNAGRKVHRVATLLALPAEDVLFLELAAIWPNEDVLVPGSTGALRLAAAPDLACLLPDAVSRMQYYDATSYLPDDIMTKVDRCSMAVALEAREPLLDHRLVEFVWKLPRRFKYDGRQTKRLLRQVLHRYVPRELVERPKMGFSIPLGNWLREDLRDWAEGLLSKKRLAVDGMFAVDEVHRLWDEHQTRRANRENVLWNVLMFQAWKEHYRV